MAQMPFFEELADEELPRRRRLRYRYGSTTVRLDYEADRACLTLIYQEFTDLPQASAPDRHKIDDQFITEFIRQNLGVDFEPDQYLGRIGGDPIVMARIEPAAGITIRDERGRVVKVIHSPDDAETPR